MQKKHQGSISHGVNGWTASPIIARRPLIQVGALGISKKGHILRSPSGTWAEDGAEDGIEVFVYVLHQALVARSVPILELLSAIVQVGGNSFSSIFGGRETAQMKCNRWNGIIEV